MAREDPSDWVVRRSQRISSDVGSRGVEPRTYTDNSMTAHLLAPASEGQPEEWSRRGQRPSNLDVTASWHTRGPGMFNRPIGTPEETPEQYEGDQGRMFIAPTQTQPSVVWARATQEHSHRVGTALGVLQNEASSLGLGSISEQSDPDLSMHSARMVGKLTGREHEVTNDIDFYSPHDPARDTVVLPREGEGPRFTEGSVGMGHQTDTTVLSKGEANLGLSRFRVAMAQSPSGQARAATRESRKRATGPQYEQQDLLNQSTSTDPH